MKKHIVSIIAIIVSFIASVAWGASPAFENFKPGVFSRSGNTIQIADGATNAAGKTLATTDGNITGNAATATNLYGRREMVVTNLPTDGTSSSTDTIQDAVKSLYALGGGTLIIPYIPNGIMAQNIQLYSGIKVVNHSTITQNGVDPTGYADRTYYGQIEQDGIFWATNSINVQVVGGTLVGDRGVDVWNGFEGFGNDLLQFFNCTNLVLDGVTVTNVGQDAIELKWCQGAVVKNCNVIDCGDSGIELRASTNTTILDCKFFRTYNGIMAKPIQANGTSSEGIIIERCTIDSFGSAMLLNVVRNTRIINCILRPTTAGANNGALRVGLDIGEHAVNTASENIFRDIVIQGNKVIGFTGNPGIRILTTTGTATVENNIIANNYIENCKGAVRMVSSGSMRGNVGVSMDLSDQSNYPVYWGNIGVNTTNTLILSENVCRQANSTMKIGSKVQAIKNDIAIIAVDSGTTEVKVSGNTVWFIDSVNGYRNTITDNIIASDRASAVISVTGEGNVIARNSMYRFGSGSSNPSINVTGNGNEISFNTISNTHAQTVVQVTSGYRNVIQGNTIYNTSSGTSIRDQGFGTYIAGNSVYGGNQLIRATGTNAIIISNVGTNGLFQGLDLTSTSATNIVIGNMLRGNSANYQDAGSRNQFYMNFFQNVGVYGISTNATAPTDEVTIKAWYNVTLPDGNVFKSPLYQ